MGSAQSSHAKNQIAPAKEQLQKLEVSVNQCVRGRKSAHEIIKQSVVVIDDIEPTLEVEDEELDDSVVYESDEELNAGLEERREILKDAQLLKLHASFHLHPEAPVTSNGNACGRNYFSRPSALEYDSLEEMEERNMILEEAALLKQYATFHLHPELPVKTTDANACGRNYFSRPSALEYDSLEEMEERNMILEEAALLKQYATFHLHPELPVKTTDANACGRNYFTRASAPEQDTCEEAEERMMVLAEAAELKKYAGYHLHPEKPVVASGLMACGRNYFTRASAPEQDTFAEAEERMLVLQEAALLKQYATFHLHPELPVKTTDANACGRNYFSRPSALEYDSLEEMEERIKILEEAALLEQYATFHLHPELPVKTTEACGYNYFFMGTAPEQDLLINRPDCEGVNETMIGNQVRRDSFEERLNILDVANAPSKSTRQLGDVSQCFFSHSCNEGEMYDDYDDNHFDHEEDISHEHLRASLSKVIVNNQFNPLGTFVSMKDDDEGHLSRSPSSIMLFGYDEGAQAH